MNYKLMLTAVSAFALGLAVQGLHAQMTPPVYVVAMNDVKDEAGYMVNSQATFLGTWDHFEYKMRHFVEVCRDDRPNEVTAEQALMIQQMLDGIYASAEQGKEVKIE